MRESLSPTPIIDLAIGFWSAKTLLSAVEIGLFTALAAGPLDRETLATRRQLHPRATRVP
jgi:8-O-methyltransferase